MTAENAIRHCAAAAVCDRRNDESPRSALIERRYRSHGYILSALAKLDYVWRVSYSVPKPGLPTKRALGIDCFDGTAAEAVAYVSKYGGLVVAPGAPSLVALQHDADYRDAIADADLAIADSGWMVLFWKLLRREQIARISGLAFSKALLASDDVRIPGNVFWILPSEKAKAKSLDFARRSLIPITIDDCYVAPDYNRCSHGSVSRAEGERGRDASPVRQTQGKLRDAATRRGY